MRKRDASPQSFRIILHLMVCGNHSMISHPWIDLSLEVLICISDDKPSVGRKVQKQLRHGFIGPTPSHGIIFVQIFLPRSHQPGFQHNVFDRGDLHFVTDGCFRAIVIDGFWKLAKPRVLGSEFSVVVFKMGTQLGNKHRKKPHGKALALHKKTKQAALATTQFVVHKARTIKPQPPLVFERRPRSVVHAQAKTSLTPLSFKISLFD